MPELPLYIYDGLLDEKMEDPSFAEAFEDGFGMDTELAIRAGIETMTELEAML